MTMIFGAGKFQAFDSSGNPLSAGEVYTYTAGAAASPANYKATYPTVDDAIAATNANTNPVVLDSRGEAFIVTAGATKLVLKDSSGSTIWTIDDVDTGAGIIYDENSSPVSNIQLATQAEQETGTSTTRLVLTGRQKYHPSAVKVWVEAGLTGNILASYNVTSLTDTGTGQLTVTYSTAMSSTTYAVLVSVGGGSTVVRCPVNSTYGTGSCLVVCVDASGALADPAGPNTWNVICMGDQ